MKTILALCLALGAWLPLCAQSSTHGFPVKGVWQQVQMTKNSGRLMRLPVWKIMQGDGTFCTFLIADEMGQSIITNQGRYEMQSDSTFVEHIEGSITDPLLVGKQNTITYRMEGADKMHIRYRVPGASRDGRESWIRVKMQMP